MNPADKHYYALRANEQIFAVLEASKSLTDKIFDELPVALIMMDQNKKILKINRVCQESMKVDESEFLGKEVDAVLPESCVKEVDEYFVRFNDKEVKSISQHKISFEVAMDIADEQRYFFWQLCEVFADSEKSVHILIGNDTTDARKVFEQMLLLNADIEIARTAQSLLLPKNEYEKTDFFEVAAFYEPAAKVGGDLWWDVNTSERYLGIVADVMGHGIGSAMVSSIAGGALNALAAKNPLQTDEDIERLVMDLDSVIYKICGGRYFICLSAITFLKSEEKATLLMAGAPPIVLFDENGEKTSICQASPPLGLLETQKQLGKSTIDFKPGNRLVCTTDGCYEFRVGEKQFGRRNFLKMLKQNHSMKPKELAKFISETLISMRQTEYAEDDITFLIVDRR